MLGVRFLDVDFMRINFACGLADCLAYTLFLHCRGCMERIVIAMQDGGTGAGAQHGGAGREANLIFVLPPNVYVGPRYGGLFGFKFSSRPHHWKFGVKRFLVLREVLARKWGGLFLGY